VGGGRRKKGRGRATRGGETMKQERREPGKNEAGGAKNFQIRDFLNSRKGCKFEARSGRGGVISGRGNTKG